MICMPVYTFSFYIWHWHIPSHGTISPRFNLKSKEGLADRKVPAQPLVFYNKEGKITRYNLRKVNKVLDD